MKRFLRMVVYNRSFCKNFAAAPLTNLLSLKVLFVWTKLCPLSFENLKALLATASILSAPDFFRPFKLAIDASDAGVWAVLVQDDSSGVEHPVCYFSQKFDPHQNSLFHRGERGFGPYPCSGSFSCVCAYVTTPFFFLCSFVNNKLTLTV